ncbi:hypothetical protein EWB00_008091, partial [Schistosoma japonicum]
IFSRHGLPDTLVSDNGAQFTSEQFQEFCRRHALNHLRSPPYYPQSNEQAERFVNTFKRALLKSKREGVVDSLQSFLLVYRTTPNDATPNKVSPAEALMNRKLKTTHYAMLPQRYPITRTNFPGFEVGTPVF